MTTYIKIGSKADSIGVVQVNEANAADALVVLENQEVIAKVAVENAQNKI